MLCRPASMLRRYMKEGRGSHADSLGNQAIVRPGGIQWLRCGSGIEHAEGGGNPEGANQHGANNSFLLSHFILKMVSFYQDRLGPNIGKPPKKKVRFAHAMQAFRSGSTSSSG